MPKYPALAIVAALSLAFAPAPVYRPKKAEPISARVVAAMESFRTEMPPAVGHAEHNGRFYTELSYNMNHLRRVADMLGVGTKGEALALLPYVKDRDCKLRFIAQHALNAATKAYPEEMSHYCFLDLESEDHRKMARRFTELIDQLDP